MYYYFDRKIEENGISIDKEEYDPKPFNKLGISIKEMDTTYNIYFKKLKKTVYQDILYADTNFIISDKLKNTFVKNLIELDNIEYYSTNLIDLKTKAVENRCYWIANILNNVDCVDFKKSEIEYYPGTDVIKNIQKLVFNETMILGRDIFRAQTKGRTMKIFVSEKLKTILEQEKITGYKLTPLSEYKEEKY
ncbi:MAG TPA: DUF1629 domain-containing protein [Cytophagaceae bacterium]|jgi:hypothetical protein|nr:DUF1629 domain-containing protein [Cytophagaceae bacterium]